MEGIWLSLRAIKGAIVATPAVLHLLGSQVVALIRWVFTEGIRLVWHGIVTTATRGVPMLVGAVFNFVFTLLTVIVAVATATLRVITTAAFEVISLF